MVAMPTPPSGDRPRQAPAVRDRRGTPSPTPSAVPGPLLPQQDLVFPLLAEWIAVQVGLVAHEAREPRAWRLRARRDWLREAAGLGKQRQEVLGQFAALRPEVLACYGFVVR